MALTRVQATGRVSVAAAASVSLTFATPPTVGNAIIVEVINFKSGGGAPSSTACTDNRGHGTYPQARQHANGNISAAIYYLPIVTGSAAPFTVTVTYGGTGYYEAAAVEVGGVGTGLAVDQVASQIANGTAVSTGATPALTASEVILAAVHAIAQNQASLTVQTVSPAWQEEFENLSYSATVAGEGDSRIVTGATGTTPSGNWTAATLGAYAAVLVAFKGPAAGSITGTGDVTVGPPALAGSGTVLAALGAGGVLFGAPMLAGSGSVLAAALRLSHLTVDALAPSPLPDLRLSHLLVDVLWRVPPGGGGEVPEAPGPPVVDAQTGTALRLFVEFKGRTPVSPGAEVPRWLLAAETGLRDPSTWHGGHKPARLVSVTTVTRELADDLRAVECRIVVADVDRLFRTYGTWGPLTGDYCAVYVVSDEVRYAAGVPYRLFAGLIQSHRAQPGFQYEFVVQDVFSTRLARLDESPRIPPYRLTLADFPGMDAQLEGKAAQIVLGEASDELAYLPDRGPQGVVPPQRLGQVNFATLWGGSNIDVDAYIWSQSALVTGGVWNVYYNPPDTPDVRQIVPASSYGVDVWTPGKPGWAMTGLATDYVDYNGRRYTPFFVRRDHPLAQAAREGKVLIAGNLFGVSDAGDGSGPYLDSAARLWQWLIVNQLFVPYTSGDYADVPLLDEAYGILDTDSVEAAHLAHHARVVGGYIVGFLLGTDGKQETLRHVLGELCAGTDLEQGINRHGQAMLSVEDVDAPAVATFTDLHDIEEGQFETWVEAEDYVDRIEHQYGWRYVPPSAPVSTPAEGEPLPKSAIPKEQQQWTSGLVVREHAAARALHSEQPPRTRAVENRVVRSPAVAANLETTWLARAVGPEPMFEGPLMFRLTTGWQGLGVTTGIPIDLGSVIAITHTEGYGQHGYITERGRVLKITVDPQRARVTLEGRLLTATTPATGE